MKQSVAPVIRVPSSYVPSAPGPCRSAILGEIARKRGHYAVVIVVATFALGCHRTQSTDPLESPKSGDNELANESVATRQDVPQNDVLPRFRAAAAELGIQFERFDDIRGLHRLAETTGGGVAAFDYDNDGWLDLFFTNGRRLPHSLEDDEHTSQLFRSVAAKSFQNVTSLAGLRFVEYCQGCAVGDFDNDGFDDLYVAAFGRNHLFHNEGDGTFSDVTEATGTDVPVWSSSVAWGDLNRDGFLDLYVANYVQESDENPRRCPMPGSPDGVVSCPPTMFHAEDDKFFLSDGAGGFHESTVASGLTGVDGKGLGVVIFDFNRDGWPDIYVANDGMPNFLYVNRTSELPHADTNEPHAKFEDMAGLLGAAVNSEGVAEAGMGIAHGDVNGDGWIDVQISHFEAETNTLYVNQQGSGFVDETRRFNLAAPTRPMLGFGTEFVDFDNDGWLDLFVANGHIDDMSWAPGRSPYRMPPQAFRNELGKRFEDVSKWSGDYFRKSWLGRGVAQGDFDRDGDVDLAISHQLSPSEVLFNETPSPGGQVSLRFIGSSPSNRSAFHARVEATGLPASVTREIAGGGGFQSASDRRIHIGMGKSSRIEKLTILWPSGKIEEYFDVLPGSYTVVEGRSGLVGDAT